MKKSNRPIFQIALRTIGVFGGVWLTAVALRMLHS
jgi:small neutral amino acid transporter SnatA (MarC family)